MKRAVCWIILLCTSLMWNASTVEGTLPIDSDYDRKMHLRTIYYEPKVYGEMLKKVYKAEMVRDGQVVADIFLQAAELSNGDLYYIIRIIGKEQKGGFTPWSIDVSSYLNQPKIARYLSYTDSGDSAQWISQEYRHQDLPNQSFFLEEEGSNGSHSSAYFSRAEVYRAGASSTLIVDKEKSHVPMFNKGKITFSVYTGKDMITEQWGILSHHSLVVWDNEEAMEALRLADKYKWTMGGMYYPMPDSYHPYHKNGYYYNPAQHVGEAFLRKAEGGRFLEDFAIVSLYNSVEMQNGHGFWWITTQSGWLFGSYGIPHMYYDTRWSTDAAVFLLNGYQKYKDPILLDSSKKYADFFANFAEGNHYKTENGGILVEDYWHPSVDVQVHSSLNHHLAEMNFLLELYMETMNPFYYDLAMKMRQGVADVARDYVKPNGDLWYAYMPDGSYDLQDYPLLTLKDLKRSQELLQKLNMVLDPDIQFLIDTKMAYRKSLGL